MICSRFSNRIWQITHYLSTLKPHPLTKVSTCMLKTSSNWGTLYFRNPPISTKNCHKRLPDSSKQIISTRAALETVTSWAASLRWSSTILNFFRSCSFSTSTPLGCTWSNSSTMESGQTSCLTIAFPVKAVNQSSPSLTIMKFGCSYSRRLGLSFTAVIKASNQATLWKR